MNVKAKALKALRDYECPDTFWYLLHKWKREGLLPRGFFSVLIQGPVQTGKSRIARQFKEQWPECKVVIQRTSATFNRGAGYDLVINTCRLSKIINTLDVCWEHATVTKSRWFPVDQKYHAL